MTPTQLAAARAHELLGELIELGMHIDAEVVGSAVCKDHEMRVTVFFTKAEKREPVKIVWPEPKPLKLPPRLAKIVAELDKATPRKAECIAARLHVACSGSFREALSLLAGLEIIKTVKGGYLLA